MLVYYWNMLIALGATEAEEEVGWDEDSDDDTAKTIKTKPEIRPDSTESSVTLNPASKVSPDKDLLKPEASRKSQDEKSQADSDTSYDVVGAASGAPSHAPGSPKESRKADDSEDEDWE